MWWSQTTVKLTVLILAVLVAMTSAGRPREDGPRDRPDRPGRGGGDVDGQAVVRRRDRPDREDRDRSSRGGRDRDRPRRDNDCPCYTLEQLEVQGGLRDCELFGSIGEVNFFILGYIESRDSGLFAQASFDTTTGTRRDRVDYSCSESLSGNAFAIQEDISEKQFDDCEDIIRTACGI